MAVTPAVSRVHAKVGLSHMTYEVKGRHTLHAYHKMSMI